MQDTLLEVEDLTVEYETATGKLQAVSNASFSIGRGEFFGLVGESGCGKSTIVKALIGGLDSNGRIPTGEIRYDGEVIYRAESDDESELAKRLAWTEIAWIPQASMNSLDPIERISDQAVEIAQTHTEMTRDDVVSRIREMFEVVGLPPDRVDDYPHQFSGGMKQRALIAMALFLDPELVIADEPTTALDVIMQDQVMKYLDRVRDDLETSMMLITHDISVVFESCDTMAIMHSGQIAEMGSVTDIYDSPRHPYSILLQGAFPDHRHPNRTLEVIEGDPPQLFGEVAECSFAGRCPWEVEECTETAPQLDIVETDDDGHSSDPDVDTDHVVACYRKDEAHEQYQQERESSETTTRSLTDGDA
jgi:oligopeptide/dipeptide ABC transporter ATP-binding protein